MQKIDDSHYSILQIIYQIVKEDPYPLKYRIHPRELILRSMQDWSVIQSSLIVLENEGVITSIQLDSLLIMLTQKGLDRCRASMPANQ